MSNSSDTKKHAIVIGGGIAGIVTARILLNHYEKVTIVERDHYPQEPVFRPGVPQGRQVHSMSLKGQRLLESLFPGLSEKLIAQGAIPQQYGYKSIYVYKNRRAPKLPPILKGWNCSRMLLEWQIRQELTRFNQVQFLEGQEVTSLLYEPQNNKVRGVRIRTRGNTEVSTQNELQELKGDLIVDASGATSRAPQWLQEGDYDTPQETVVDAHLGYATQIYEQPADFQAEWTGIAIQVLDKTRRGAVLMRVENARWMVVLAGTDEDYPSTEEEAYRTFAQRLPDPVLYEAIKEAKPISPIYGFRRTANRLNHFELLKRFPDNFVVVGDSVCCLNPIYGQGMTVAILEAMALDTSLNQWKNKTDLKGFSHSYQRKAIAVIKNAWRFAAAGDAPRKDNPGLTSRYMEQVIDTMTADKEVLLTFIEVTHMLRSPLALVSPTTIWKVFLYKMKSSLHRQKSA